MLKFQLGGIPLIGLIRTVADVGPDRRYLCREPQQVQGRISARGNGPVVTPCQCFGNCIRVGRYIFIKQFAVLWLFVNASDNSAFNYNSVLNAGYDAVNSRGYNRADYYSRSLIDFLWRGICLRAFKYAPISKCDQKKINQYMYVKEDKWNNVFPTLMPNWDRTARSGSKARIYTNSTPKLFRKQLLDVLDILSNKDSEYRIAFLMSWNEWAEGNYGNV